MPPITLLTASISTGSQEFSLPPHSRAQCVYHSMHAHRVLNCCHRAAHPHIVGVRKLRPGSSRPPPATLDADSYEGQITRNLRTLEWTLVTMHFMDKWSYTVHQNAIVSSPAHEEGRDVLNHIISLFLLQRADDEPEQQQQLCESSQEQHTRAI